MFGMNGFHVSASGAIQGHLGPLVFVFEALESKISVFQTKDNGICRQKVRFNPSLLLDFGNYENSNVRTKSVRNLQLVLS